MKIFKTAKNNTNQVPQIAPTTTIDVFSIQNSSMSIQVDVQKNNFLIGPFSNREARLRVKITNEGAETIENLSIDANAPRGTLLVDPGILFGNERRHVRLPRLLPSKSVTYKLGMRAQAGFTSGILEIFVRESSMNAGSSGLQMKIALRADNN